ncbi:hypothetical protein AX774_g1185 [Zancudomyces culisetae]|uniref:Uncharacterized protein n=1 Tax=Zancudomyces culisetae TaxID=1213189 RepID=A0A1R1PWC0_ZANCU|nr:hypothetical protein AX774_g1185 [Zancudomyces culisetae]|eukprot:OMH85260.1 hypothetical protein AX774_g1185 [Zancudomyces culisetae]
MNSIDKKYQRNESAKKNTENSDPRFTNNLVWLDVSSLALLLPEFELPFFSTLTLFLQVHFAFDALPKVAFTSLQSRFSVESICIAPSTRCSKGNEIFVIGPAITKAPLTYAREANIFSFMILSSVLFAIFNPPFMF